MDAAVPLPPLGVEHGRGQEDEAPAAAAAAAAGETGAAGPAGAAREQRLPSVTSTAVCAAEELFANSVSCSIDTLATSSSEGSTPCMSVRLVAVGNTLLAVSDHHQLGAVAHVRRSLFAFSYLSRQSWLQPSKYDAPQAALAKSVVQLEDVLAVLRRIPSKHWHNSGRHNVRPRGTSAIDSLTLGLVCCASTQGQPLPSRFTRLYPNLCRLLLRLWSQSPALDSSSEAQQEQPAYCTSIQLNRNYAAREHVDANNYGPSWIIAGGDWTAGGELWVEDSAGEEEHVLPDDVLGSHGRYYLRGTRCLGRGLDVHGRWAHFDGRRLHFVRSFLGGDRFSMVFFTTARHDTVPSEARRFLTGLGFLFPPVGVSARVKRSRDGRTRRRELLPTESTRGSVGARSRGVYNRQDLPAGWHCKRWRGANILTVDDSVKELQLPLIA